MACLPLELVHGTSHYRLDRHVVTVGRQPDCDVILEGDAVSRCHAAIIPTPAGPLLVDQSRHGVLINEEKVLAPRVLAGGERIRIGDAVLRIQLDLQAAPDKAKHGGTEGRLRSGLRFLGGTIGTLVGMLALDFVARPSPRERDR